MRALALAWVVVAQFGRGSFSETGTMLTLSPPEVSIRSDGSVIYVDEDGVWTGMLPAAKVDQLRSDLAREPLLRETAYVQTRKPLPIMMHGGMSYIQFGDVVIATSGVPTRGPWIAITDRIRREIPPSAHSFVPASLTFFTIADQNPLPRQAEWPFAAVLPLGGSEPKTTEDSAIVGWIMRTLYRRNGWQTDVTQGPGAFRMFVLEAPGWLDDGTLAPLVEGLRAERH